nr:retrovirus-related Pol polyprotein from transposon TNT 1-94 [Tanacetum cinerariifolium]
LDEEQLLFLTGGQPNTFDDDVDEGLVQDMAQNEDNIFQDYQRNTFESDVDEAPTAQTMFMANLSSAGPVYDEAGPSYDSDALSEILPPWKQAEKIYLLGSNKWYQSLLRALTKEEFFSPFNPTSLTTMSDDDSLVNSVHEGDAPKLKITPPPPQITTVTSLSAKFPYLNKGEYDI